MPDKKYTRLLRRFLKHTRRLPSGCLECDLSPNWDGYPNMNVDGKCRPISHVAWFLHYGEWPPPGMEAHHTCHDPKICAGGPDDPHRRCAEWSHLILLTPQDHNRPGLGHRLQPLLFCGRGHPLTPENVYRFKRPDGSLGRQCRECHRIRDKIRYDAIRALQEKAV